MELVKYTDMYKHKRDKDTTKPPHCCLKCRFCYTSVEDTNYIINDWSIIELKRKLTSLSAGRITLTYTSKSYQNEHVFTFLVDKKYSQA